MAVTLNIKTSKTLLELFSGLDSLSYEYKSVLNKAQIYYQTHCFDILLERAQDMVCVRFATPQTGSLMQGMLGKAPHQALQKSVAYCLKAVLTTYFNQDAKAGTDVNSIPAESTHATIGITHGYYDFLKIIGDEKATPSEHKPKETQEPKAVKPVGLDFSKLEQKAAAAYADVKNTPIGEVTKLGHGIQLVETTYKEAVYPDHTKADVVSLSVACALGQRVRGTSANSVYYVCALGTCCNLAYRLSGDSFSIRLESVSNQKFSKTSSIIDKILGAGMDVVYTNSGVLSHASIHFEGMDYKKARRVLGAVMADLAMFQPSEMCLTVKTK